MAPNLSQNQFVVYKDQALDTGYFYAPYIPVSSCGIQKINDISKIDLNLNIESSTITAKARKLKSVWTVDTDWTDPLPNKKLCAIGAIRKNVKRWFKQWRHV